MVFVEEGMGGRRGGVLGLFVEGGGGLVGGLEDCYSVLVGFHLVLKH